MVRVRMRHQQLRSEKLVTRVGTFDVDAEGVFEATEEQSTALIAAFGASYQKLGPVEHVVPAITVQQPTPPPPPPVEPGPVVEVESEAGEEDEEDEEEEPATEVESGLFFRKKATLKKKTSSRKSRGK